MHNEGRRGGETRMSQSSAAEGLERGEPKALECFCSFVQSNCKYIQAGHNPSEVTGKDGMIYQTGRQAGRQAASGELLLLRTERCKGE